MNTTKRIKHIKLIITIIGFTIFILASSYTNINSQANSNNNTTANDRELPDIVILDDPEANSSAGDKGKVPFNHKQHISQRADLTCVTCHHTNTLSLTAAIEERVAKCTTCHKQDDSLCEIEGTNENKKFKGKTALNSKDAYHGTGGVDNTTGCITCHKERDIAPVSCRDCHTDSSEVRHVIQPLFPTIRFEIRNQFNQINQPTPNWQNTYSYNRQPNHYPQNHQPNNYYSYNNPPRDSNIIIAPDKKVEVTVNNYIPNNSNITIPPQAEPIVERVVVEREKNYDWLLEDNRPLKENNEKIDQEKPSEKATSSLGSIENNILPSLTAEPKAESLMDQILNHINKFIVLIVLALYLDIRRRMNN